MREFNPPNLQIPKSQGEDLRVIKLDLGVVELQVEDFKANEFKRGFSSYQQVKDKMGSLAASDERRVRPRKDERFLLNSASKERLEIEHEERRILEERVQAEIARLREEAKVQGHAEGLEAGRRQGIEEATAEYKKVAEEKLSVLEGIARQMEGFRSAIYQANEAHLIQLVYRVARMCLMKELKADPDYVKRLAKLLVERVGVRDHIKIGVSEYDAASVGELRESLEKAFGQMQNLQIAVNPQILSGGCILETERNLIDADVDQQLEAIRQELLGEQKK